LRNVPLTSWTRHLQWQRRKVRKELKKKTPKQKVRSGREKKKEIIQNNYSLRKKKTNGQNGMFIDRMPAAPKK